MVSQNRVKEHHGVLTHLLPEDHMILDEDLGEYPGMLNHLLPEDQVILDEGLEEHH